MSSSSTSSPTNNRSRVKLYTLNEERQWEDRGTGFVTCISPTPINNSHSIIVKSEIDGSILLESKIQLHTKYQKQQETLIVWSEGENYDLALSFQEKLGCDDIWENICDVQGKDSSIFLTNSTTDSTIYESDDECIESNENYLSSTMNLPPVDLTHLRDICDLFLPERIRDATRRDYLARSIESQNYIRKLIDLFHICEDLEDLESLHQLYEIIRSIFYLNKSTLFEILFNNEVIFDIIGCLEYEPTIKRNHREFLNKKATFKEIIPINNQELLNKIHQTYRIQYIQDAILPTPNLFEENFLSTMNSFLFFNKIEIVTLLYEDPKFLSQLFSTIKNDQLSNDKRKDLMLFLKEFCLFSQTLQQQNRDHFFQALATHGILNVIQVMLSLDDQTTRQASLDVFASIVECNPSTVREYMLQETQTIQDDDELLLNLIISEIQNDTDPELSGALNLMNYLKLLIDPENMMTVSISEKTEFLSFFYLRSMSILLAPLITNTMNQQILCDDFHHAQLQYFILDFLTFCIEHHTYHMRNFLNKKDLLRHILILLKSKHQFLQLSALRFFRKLVALKDEQYNLIIVRKNYFAPIVDAFKANKRRYNLLNSALIELFEFIRQDDIKILIYYFIENFYSDFQTITYVKTFHDLKIRYETYHDKYEHIFNENSSISCTYQRLRQDDDDDDDDQIELTSAISRSSSSSASSDDDENDMPISSRSFSKKPIVNIQIGRLAQTSESYSMVKSPALTNIADQYNDDDDDDDNEEENSDAYSNTNKRKIDHEDDEHNKLFKKTSEQFES